MVRGTGLVGRAIARFEQRDLAPPPPIPPPPREITPPKIREKPPILPRSVSFHDLRRTKSQNVDFRHQFHSELQNDGNITVFHKDCNNANEKQLKIDSGYTQQSQSFIPKPVRPVDVNKCAPRLESMISQKTMTSQGECPDETEVMRLKETEAALRAELQELREHNELLEFRLLEKSACCDESDVSDSGVSEELVGRDSENRDLDHKHRDYDRLLSLSSPTHRPHHREDLVTRVSNDFLSLSHKHEVPEELLSPLSMHESGIFDSLMVETESKSTQTELELESTPDLRREIQKLLQFREKCSNVKSIEINALLQKLNDTSHGECERLNTAIKQHELKIKELNKICERLGEENKKLDEERRKCGNSEALRVQESRIRELSERCERLVHENRRLDEERNEFEEAENDARHISQRLECRVSWLNEQSLALRSELRRYAAERGNLRRDQRRWESKALRLEERNFELEERHLDTRERLAGLEEAVPVLVAFGVAISRNRKPRIFATSISTLSHVSGTRALLPATASCAVQTEEDSEVVELRAKVQAYGETLRLADQLWSQAETEYQSRLHGAEATLTRLRERVSQLEEHVVRVRAVCDEEALKSLQKRVSTLQRSERALQQHVHELESNEASIREELQNVESGAHARESRLRQELSRRQEELAEARAAVTEAVRAQQDSEQQLAQVRARCEAYKREIQEKKDALADTQNALVEEESRSRTYKTRAALQLAEAECTSGELREEVDTLEANVIRLRTQLDIQQQSAERAILRLNLQVSDRERELSETRRELELAGHHEAGVAALAQRAALAAHALQDCSRCRCSLQPEVREISAQLRALATIISGDHITRFNPKGSMSEDEEEITYPNANERLPTGSRVRAVQRALLEASKPGLLACPTRAVAEITAR